MTYQDEDRIRNPNDPWQREWGTGSIITVLFAVAIMAGIIVYGATNINTVTGPSSSAPHPTITGQAGTSTPKISAIGLLNI
jgi:hypothetical protein